MGDLVTCGDVLLNYLEAYEAIPWDDLRYMFGEVGARVAGAGWAGGVLCRSSALGSLNACLLDGWRLRPHNTA